MKFCLILVLAAFCAVSAEVGSDLGSTLKIVFRLCYIPGDHSDPIAKEFFECYDTITVSFYGDSAENHEGLNWFDGLFHYGFIILLVDHIMYFVA
jgi:nitrate reductase gamma subunit